MGEVFKFVYVIEDGEIVEKTTVKESEVESTVNELCEEFFDGPYEEKDVEKNGILFTVTETEMVFVTTLDVSNVEDLWG